MTIDAIEHITRHVVETDFDDLPQEAVEASQKFILDSIGVGLAGSGGPWVTELINAMGAAPARDSARVWGQDKVLDARAAALCNAYQIHNAEYDLFLIHI